MPSKEALRDLLSANPFEVEESALDEALLYGGAVVSAFCRGRHVYSDGRMRPGVRECILSVAARYAVNPSGHQMRVQAGGFSASVGASGEGLSLAERNLLGRYRRTSV